MGQSDRDAIAVDRLQSSEAARCPPPVPRLRWTSSVNENGAPGYVFAVVRRGSVGVHWSSESAGLTIRRGNLVRVRLSPRALCRRSPWESWSNRPISYLIFAI